MYFQKEKKFQMVGWLNNHGILRKWGVHFRISESNSLGWWGLKGGSQGGTRSTHDWGGSYVFFRIEHLHPQYFFEPIDLPRIF